ncbi:MAG: PQQ-dependent sugar dehydrogenase [Planctomycetaceae bacterium]|jgi:glucose/arabinose dehydrogenase
MSGRTGVAMWRLAVVALAGGLLAGGARAWAEENSLTSYEQRTGWKMLFDGKSTNGWRNYRKTAVNPGWVVEEGALVRSGKGAGDIVTVDQYDSFELSLEYRISKGGNSGIMFHVTEEMDAPWQTGPEVQVQDNVDGHDPQKAGWLYQLYQPMPDFFTKQVTDATRPVGEWNQVTLKITPAVCEINMNGIRYAMFQKGSDDWNARVAKSKFKQWAPFGKATKGHICLQDHGDLVAYRNIKIRSLPVDKPLPEPVDGELAVGFEPAFPGIAWAGFEGVDENGKPQTFRPIVLTHAGDGSGRRFVATQHGVIHVVPAAGEKVAKSEIFADLSDRVVYKDNENEEGLLGLAFHPKFKENGQFFVYYTSKKHPAHTSVVSRFRVKPDGSGKFDTSFEEEVLVIPQPFWNHNGGTLCFGPDGMLYIALGDGGAGNDPLGNAQNLETLLGDILRIDVNRKSEGLAYGIPADNPFVGQAKARPEIYASGVRNIWRMAFDRQTGTLWAADVGQNLFEEINLIEKGGNYGWNLREAGHAFGSKGAPAGTRLIDPIFEYDHQVGSSITGGHVYRGKQVPVLAGRYLYADYVTGRLWALQYDEQARKVVSNMSIPSPKLPVISFGEDESGEAYFMIVTADGQGVFRLVAK